MARTKLNNTILKAILKTVEAGVPIPHAARAVGINDRTFRSWRARGEKPQGAEDNIYSHLCQGIEEAEAKFIKVNVERVDKAADKDPNHAEWLLERRWPGIFGKRVEIEIGPSKVLLALQEEAQKSLDTPGSLTEGETPKTDSQSLIPLQERKENGNKAGKRTERPN